jgi:hypothetical protein
VQSGRKSGGPGKVHSLGDRSGRRAENLQPTVGRLVPWIPGFEALAKHRTDSEPLLDALANISVTSGPVVCSALALGLSAKNGAKRTHAVVAIVDLADQGNLDGTQLGLQISWLLSGGVS